MMAVSVALKQGRLNLGHPTAILQLTSGDPTVFSYFGGGNMGAGYDVAEDGRFVMVRGPSEAVREIVVVQNWFAELQRMFAER
jgi:hypothetical protein